MDYIHYVIRTNGRQYRTVIKEFIEMQVVIRPARFSIGIHAWLTGKLIGGFNIMPVEKVNDGQIYP